MKFLLDTHVLVWWRHGDTDKLTSAQTHALSEMEKRRQPAALSAITLWELAMLVERRRLAISKSLDLWLDELESHPLVTILPLTTKIVAESVRLGTGFHRDAADRLIVATARCHDLTLITADDRIRKWGKLNLI